MPSKNQTVVKINKNTLELVRKIAAIEKSTPPKVIDRAVTDYSMSYSSEELSNKESQ
jgi:hypothetical protein